MKVTIPAREEHQGFYAMTVEISDKCPKCGGPRAKQEDVFSGLSYDGSRRLKVDCWKNPCGHVDTYGEVRAEVYRNQHPGLVGGGGKPGYMGDIAGPGCNPDVP